MIAKSSGGGGSPAIQQLKLAVMEVTLTALNTARTCDIGSGGGESARGNSRGVDW